jgi:hypothetical protein
MHLEGAAFREINVFVKWKATHSTKLIPSRLLWSTRSEAICFFSP